MEDKDIEEIAEFFNYYKHHDFWVSGVEGDSDCWHKDQLIKEFKGTFPRLFK